MSEHVELAHASSVWAAQGRMWVALTPSSGSVWPGRVLYVAATRGRGSNRLYVDTEPEAANADMAEAPIQRLAAREMLVALAFRHGADISTHETMGSECPSAESLEQLVKEHHGLVAATRTIPPPGIGANLRSTT